MPKMNEQTAKLMPVYRNIIDEVFDHDKHMVDYCAKKIDQLVPLDNGMFIEIEKQSIKKDFCFGYSDSPYDTEDYDRANRMACIRGRACSHPNACHPVCIRRMPRQ